MLSKIPFSGEIDLSDFIEMRGDRRVMTHHTFLLEGTAGFFNPDPDHTYMVLNTTFGIGISDVEISYIFTHTLRRVL